MTIAPLAPFLLVGVALAVGPLQGSPSDSTAVPPGSSPRTFFLETWDGERWRFVVAPCKVALAPALVQRDLTRLEPAWTERGLLRLRMLGAAAVHGELDAINLVAVDHDSAVTVAPDGMGLMHAVERLDPPVRAHDGRRDDVLASVARIGGDFWEAVSGRIDPTLPAQLTETLEVHFSRPPRSTAARLVVDAILSPWAETVLWAAVKTQGFQAQAWFDAMLADTLRFRRVRESFRVDTALRVSLRALEGWVPQGEIPASGPGAFRRFVVPLDLSRTLGGTIQVRLTETPGFWRIDRVAIDTTPDSEILVQEVRPETAWSARRVDVRGPLIQEDRVNYTLRHRDRVTMRFRTPPPSADRRRTYFVQATAWQRPLTNDWGQPDIATAEALQSSPGALGRFSVTHRSARRADSTRTE